MDAKWVFRRSYKKRDVQTNISEKLGYKDSNLEMTESESVALPFGDSPLYFVLCFLSVSLSDKMYYIAPLRKMQVFFSNFLKKFFNLFSGRFFVFSSPHFSDVFPFHFPPTGLLYFFKMVYYTKLITVLYLLL